LEDTITFYGDVVASAPLTILTLSNLDATIVRYVNTSAVLFANCIYFSVVHATKQVWMSVEGLCEGTKA
jgi:hypothetical protein